MRDVTLHRLCASEPIGDLSSSFPGEFVKENTFFLPIGKIVSESIFRAENWKKRGSDESLKFRLFQTFVFFVIC